MTFLDASGNMKQELIFSTNEIAYTEARLSNGCKSAPDGRICIGDGISAHKVLLHGGLAGRESVWKLVRLVCKDFGGVHTQASSNNSQP